MKQFFKEMPEVVHNAVLNALDSLEENPDLEYNVVSVSKKNRGKK